MRVAIVDLGTNTFNLLIADILPSGFKLVHKEKRAVKLGKSGINSGVIAPDAFERGLDAMKYYSDVIQKNDVVNIMAVATSAMRDSGNASEFVKQVKDTTGIDINIISGQREAELIQKGVAQTLPSEFKDYVIMDIGGGSTEFIIVTDKEVKWAKSYNLGVSRLLDWLQPSDPISENQITKLKSRLNEELEELYDHIATHNITTMVGSSGSFDSFHDMITAQDDTDLLSSELDFSPFSMADVSMIHHRLLKTTLDERLAFPGLVKMRADMIVIASLEIQTVLEKCNTTRLFRSAFALKEGLISELEAN